MKNRVYIKKISFYNENEDISLDNKNIDTISHMCIVTIGKLLSEMANQYKNVPIFFGTAYSCLKSLHEFNTVSEVSGALGVNPSLFPNTVLNAPSSYASIHHKITQPIYNISNGNESAVSALELAYSYIHNNEYKHAVLCLADEASWFSRKIDEEQKGYCAAIYLSANEGELYIEGIKHNVQFGYDDKIEGNYNFIQKIKEMYHNRKSGCLVTPRRNKYYTVIKFCVD